MPGINNVIRFLQKKGIDFQVFELPAEKLSALQTADLLGVPPERVFKTIVVKRLGRGKPLLAVVPAHCDVDLKKLAAAAGEKKLKLPTQKEAESLTRLQAGGISPLALLQRGFQVFLDESARQLDFMHISAGKRGLNLRLAPLDLQKITQATLADISIIKKA